MGNQQKRKKETTEIYLHIPAFTVSYKRQTFYTLALHLFLFAIESHESSGCFYGEVFSGLAQFAHATRHDATSDVTKNILSIKKRLSAQWSIAQIKHRR